MSQNEIPVPRLKVSSSGIVAGFSFGRAVAPSFPTPPIIQVSVAQATALVLTPPTFTRRSHTTMRSTFGWLSSRPSLKLPREGLLGWRCRLKTSLSHRGRFPLSFSQMSLSSQLPPWSLGVRLCKSYANFDSIRPLL